MVLVTGASGFLGQHLVRFLSAEGIPLRALYHSQPPTHELASLPGVAWIKCDLLDVFAVEEVLEGISDVYHCAAIVSYRSAMHEQMLHFNPESTANLVDQALTQGIRKLVYVSSIAAMGRSGIEDKMITEEQEWGESKYHSAYAISKFLAETEVWRAIGEGLNAVIINPGIILGNGDWEKGSARLIKVVNSEFPYYTDGVSAWVGVEDVVRVMATLMELSIASERFIVSTGNHSFREVFTMMASSLGKRPPRIKANSLMTAAAWRLSAVGSALTGRETLITKETSQNAHSVSYYDNQKLLNTLPGFSYTPLEKVVETMARSFINSNKK